MRFVASSCRYLLHRILYGLRVASDGAVEVLLRELQVVLTGDVLRIADPFADDMRGRPAIRICTSAIRLEHPGRIGASSAGLSFYRSPPVEDGYARIA